MLYINYYVTSLISLILSQSINQRVQLLKLISVWKRMFLSYKLDIIHNTSFKSTRNRIWEFKNFASPL